MLSKLIIPQDKANHFFYGALITCLFSLHYKEYGFFACVFIAVAKELYDKVSGKGEMDIKDLYMTLLGGVVATLPYYNV